MMKQKIFKCNEKVAFALVRPSRGGGPCEAWWWGDRASRFRKLIKMKNEQVIREGLL